MENALNRHGLLFFPVLLLPEFRDRMAGILAKFYGTEQCEPCPSPFPKWITTERGKFASSGIGRATALAFAKNGYRLSLNGRNETALNQLAEECVTKCGLTKEQIISTVGDVCEEKTLNAIMERTAQRFGQIDVLVNCAGIISVGGAKDTPLSVLDGLMRVNVNSMIRLSQLAVPYLEKTKGSIVNVSSIAGICAFPAVSYYSISKAAVDKFTECLALELAPKGIRVNAVNPALIVTEIHKRAGMSEEQYAEFLKRGESNHALGRVGHVDEVANCILFLARDATFCTGNLMKIDGGKALMVPR